MMKICQLLGRSGARSQDPYLSAWEPFPFKLFTLQLEACGCIYMCVPLHLERHALHAKCFSLISLLGKHNFFQIFIFSLLSYT